MNDQNETQKALAPRLAPIIWGVLILGFCVWITDQKLFSGTVAPEIWVTTVVLIIGALLLAVGITAVIRNNKKQS